MKVILLKDVAKVGKKGELHEVSDGFGRNYLLVRGLAEIASEGKLRALDKENANKAAAAERVRQAARDLGAKLTANPIVVTAKSGEGGKLFGSITSQTIADAVKAQVGIELDKRNIKIENPIKCLGDVKVTVKLHVDVKVQMIVSIKGA